MRNTHLTLLITVTIALLFLVSCSNTAEIPFPEKTLGYTQPVTEPLQFTKEKNLVFDTAKRGGVKPVVKKFLL